jgi:hypothetical protein
MAPDWHPIMAAQEGPSGTWRMIDPDGNVYGVIDIRRRAGQIVYRARLGEEVLGYAGSLKLAAHRTHIEFYKRAQDRSGPPNGIVSRRSPS